MSISAASFHNLIIDEDLAPSQITKQKFLRALKARPDVDGYGLEVWNLPFDIGTHKMSSSADDVEDVLICNEICFLDIHLKNEISLDFISEALKKKSTTKKKKLLVFYNSSSSTENKNEMEKVVKFSSEALDFLIEATNTTDALITAIGILEGTKITFNFEKSFPPIPIVNRIDSSLLQFLNVDDETATSPPLQLQIFILPLRYGNFSQFVLPTSIVVIVNKSSFDFDIVHDCTQHFTSACHCFPGGQKPISVGASSSSSCCPFKKYLQTTTTTATTTKNEEETENYSSSSSVFILTEDIGTHVDAAKHFYEKERAINEYDGKDFFVPAVIIDISEKVFVDEHLTNADAGVTKQDILDWETKNGRKIPSGAFVAMRSGFGRFFNPQQQEQEEQNKSFYLRPTTSEEDQQSLCFPGFELEAVEFLFQDRNIVGLGVDTLSVDKGTATEFPVHSYFLKHSKFHVENMNLENIIFAEKLKELFFLIAPLRIRDGYEAPCRMLLIGK
jgi:kynurenine formamidase